MSVQDLELVALIRTVILNLKKEQLELPDNTVCYADGISIPHTWRTIESHNNKFYTTSKMEYLIGGGTDMTVGFNYDPYIAFLPEGNYTGANLAHGIQELLNGFAATFDSDVLYHPARGTFTIEAKPEGVDSHNKFHIPSDLGIVTWMSSTENHYPWKDSQGNITTVEINNTQSINGVLRNSDMITINLEPEYYRTYGSGFIDSLNAHNVYPYCTNLGHFYSIGVRGGNTIIEKPYIFTIRLFDN